MAWYNPKSWIDKEPQILTEEIKSFKNKGEDNFSDRHLELRSGEGIDDLSLINNVQGYGKEALTSFNQFYTNHINVEFENERARIFHYRQMAEMPEVADVIEDAVIESTHEDTIGNLITLEIRDKELESNSNIVKNIQEEFDDLFYNRIDIKEAMWDMLRTYYIDGRVYYERLIHSAKSSNGVIGIKKLPTETMDYLYDPKTGKVIAYFQYLNEKGKKYNSIDAARQDNNVIVFYPEQIGFVNYGVYGKSKTQILGYLEKSKQPFNQLKLLETSVIIYRLVRSPERLVFRIDTGNMPKDKAMKFVENIKQKFTKKITYDSATGQMSNSPEVFSVLENFFLPQSADGRGSQIDSIGGNPAGFAELDDIYYFARKLYRSLKYPMSRVSAQESKSESDIVFGGTNAGEIQRDEIKWSKFLERHQMKFCSEFVDLFLLHLDFKGLKKEYDLDRSKIHISLTAPNNYKDQMAQQLLTTQMSNYSTLASNVEFSKSFLQKTYLKWDDDMIKQNAEGFKLDKELLPKEDDGY
jgi:hypothetical protein